LGIKLFEQENWEDAEHHYHEVLRLNSELVDAQYNLGLVLAGQGKTGEAVENFRSVIPLAPKLL